MPIITINEVETPSLAAFDVTENVVALPILKARDFELKDGIELTGNTDITDDIVDYVDLDDSPILLKSVSDLRSAIDIKTFVEGELDKSFVIAHELLSQGLMVVIKPILYPNASSMGYVITTSTTEVDSEGRETEVVTYSLGKNTSANIPTYDEAHEIVENAVVNNGAMEVFKDRNSFNVKFITTGGYTNAGNYKVESSEEVISDMGETIMNIAAARGDAVALIDFREIFTSEADVQNTVASANNLVNNSDGKYAAAFLPWCTFSSSASGSSANYDLPGSFAYLMAYANSVKTNANWFAAAGVTRGRIPGLIKPLFNVGEGLMHLLQGDTSNSDYTANIAVNPIYNAGTYGYRIWGNRTLDLPGVENTKFTNFLNVRILLCDIKKQVYHAAMRVTFEPNDDIVWINFKTLANSLLDRMKSGRGLSWYKWTKEAIEEKAKIKATLTIRPIEAVESFDITILLTDDEASVEEE